MLCVIQYRHTIKECVYMRDPNANLILSEKVSKSLIGKIGKESRRWKGNEAGYVAKHMWIKKYHGKALKCSNDNNHKALRYEWANISGEYKRDITDYIELCPSCHRKMDLFKNICKHGHILDEANTYIDTRGFKQCRLCMKEASMRWRLKCVQ